MKAKRKNRVHWIKLLVIVLVTAIVTLSLIVTNLYIPVLYLPAYFNGGRDKNVPGRLRIRYLDVGYGDCALIELPDGKNMLVDGGKGDYNSEYRIFSVLNSCGIDHIDYLVCTSVNGEHCGGLAEILKYKGASEIYRPLVYNINITDEYAAFERSALKSGASLKYSRYGEGVYSGEWGYYFCFLSPAALSAEDSFYDDMNADPTRENIDNASAVMWLEYGGYGFMFLSDAQVEAQSAVAKQLLADNESVRIGGMRANISQCAVIKSSRHAEEGMNGSLLYDLLSPSAAVVSVGENGAGAPALKELADIQLFVGNNVYRTDSDGTVTVTVNDGIFTISKERQ